MNDVQVIAIIAAIIGHDDLHPGGRVGAKEESIGHHVLTAREILAEVAKQAGLQPPS